MLQIGGEHGGEIAIVKTFQERMALLANVFVLSYQWGIDKDAALLFIGQGALCDQAFDKGLYGFRAPGGAFHQTVCNFVCADGRGFPYDFHHFKFRF